MYRTPVVRLPVDGTAAAGTVVSGVIALVPARVGTDGATTPGVAVFAGRVFTDSWTHPYPIPGSSLQT